MSGSQDESLKRGKGDVDMKILLIVTAIITLVFAFVLSAVIIDLMSVHHECTFWEMIKKIARGEKDE